MTTAILIGFRHQAGVISTLPGALIDIHRAHQFCERLNWKTHVLSDISDEKLPAGIAGVVAHGEVDMSIMTFMAKITKDLITINSSKELKDNITDILKATKHQRVFIYYSGHGLSSAIVCPNNDKLDFLDLRNIITDNCTGNVFLTLDCCQPPNIFLAYNLQETKDNGCSFVINSTYIPCKTKILLVTSASADQASAATKFGSLFSGFFFDYLSRLCHKKIEKWPSRNLGVIKKHINSELHKSKTGYKQTMNVYCSHVDYAVLWSWITNMSFDIQIDTACKSIILVPLK